MTGLEEFAHHIDRTAAGDDDSARLLRKFILAHVWTFPRATLLAVCRAILHCWRGDVRGE